MGRSGQRRADNAQVGGAQLHVQGQRLESISSVPCEISESINKWEERDGANYVQPKMSKPRLNKMEQRSQLMDLLAFVYPRPKRLFHVQFDV